MPRQPLIRGLRTALIRGIALIPGLFLFHASAWSQAPADREDSSAVEPAPPAASMRPNILMIVADDMGVDQVAAYGEGTDLPATPTLSLLAQNGTRFNMAWSDPVCSPTRATIQTGRYSCRTGIGDLVEDWTFALRLNELTLPEMLDAGTGGAYSHAAIGKWHLGNAYVGGIHSPNNAGYMHYAGAPRNLDHGSYFSWRKVVDGIAYQSNVYATTDNVNDALDFIASVPEPWFCYLAFNAPHGPYHEPPANLHSIDFSQQSTRRMRYKAMVEAMDTEIGRLLTGIGNEGLGRTDVIFLGDNGTPEGTLAAGVPRWQSKRHLYQGGVRIPLIVAGPSVQSPGSACDALVNTTDLFATVAEMAGVDLGALIPPQWPMDSVSLVPYLEDPSRPSMRNLIYSEYFHENGFGPFEYGGVVITDGEYKLIFSRDWHQHEPREFYDLRTDPLEYINLLDHPLSQEAAQRMQWLRDQIQDIRN